MVDIHSHVLPGLDDGAATLEESLEMIKLAAASGTTDLVATPHANQQYSFDEESIDRAFHSVSGLTRGIINLYRGCDFHLNARNLQDALLHPTKYAINASRYLLVELPNLVGTSAVWQQLACLINARFCPIITHPERNLCLQSNLKILRKWVECGCLLQVTAQSLLGRFGPEPKHVAESLMDQELVHFVASDAHDCVDRPPFLSAARDLVSRRWGQATAQRVFVGNPAAVIADAPVDRTRQLTSRFSLFSFGRK